MKYTAVEFDANRPVVNMTTTPFNSRFGVAVKVLKNGSVLDLSENEIVIEGAENKGKQGDWTLFELSSGNIPSIITKSVVLNSAELSATFKLQISTRVSDVIEQ